MMQESLTDLELEVALISEYKCFLLNEEETFIFNDEVVDIYFEGNYHYLAYGQHRWRLEVIAKEIYDFKIIS